MNMPPPSPHITGGIAQTMQLPPFYGNVNTGGDVIPEKAIMPIPQTGHDISRFLFFTIGMETEPASFMQRRNCAPIMRLEKIP
jgi:hypothetical protein